MRERRISENKLSATLMIFLSVLILITHVQGVEIAARSIDHKLPAASALLPRPVTEHFVTVDGLRVHYIESGTGPTVVMIHGNAGSVEDFELGAMDLLALNYRVVAVDRPGHGDSDRPAGKVTVEVQARLLRRTLSRLGIHQPILVGHSWGGSLALAYALHYPGDVSAIVLLAPAAYPDAGENRLLGVTSRIPLIGDLSFVLGGWVIGHHMIRAGLSRAFYPQSPSDRYVKLADSLWLRRKQLKAYVEDETSLNESLRKMSKRYQEIKIPVVIVTGDRDQIVSPDQNARLLHAAIPNSQLIELKDTGHEIPQINPESIDTALSMISQPWAKAIERF
jgi:pimeloyl-ACP methyl ester carboxylesterase